MDSVYPLINSAELPPFIWGDSHRETVCIKHNINLPLTTEVLHDHVTAAMLDGRNNNFF
jgi:hypothetical protein